MDMRHYKEWVKIGLNILYYRKERHLTQQQLADECGEDGISRAFIQRIETGVSSCSLDTLMDIAKALNVPLYKLFEYPPPIFFWSCPKENGPWTVQKKRRWILLRRCYPIPAVFCRVRRTFVAFHFLSPHKNCVRSSGSRRM